MLAETAQAGRDIATRGHEHPAFPRGEQLARVKGEGGQIGAGADRLAIVGRADGACRILDHRDPVRLAQRLHGVEISRDACLVHQDHGAGARGQAWFDRRGRQVLGGLVDVREHGHGPDIPRRVRGRDERERGDDDLVTRADPGNDES